MQFCSHFHLARRFSTSGLRYLKQEATRKAFESKSTPSLVVGLFSVSGRKYVGRRLEKLPSEKQAPHIKVVYMNEMELFLIFIPSVNLIGAPCLIASNLIHFLGVFPSTTTALELGVVNLYGALLIVALNVFLRRSVVRVYHNEEIDRSFATFLHPLVPLRYRRREFHHQSMYQYAQINFFKNVLFKNDHNEKYFIYTDNFRSMRDFHRYMK